jgi:hypothetical protein
MSGARDRCKGLNLEEGEMATTAILTTHRGSLRHSFDIRPPAVTLYSVLY